MNNMNNKVPFRTWLKYALLHALLHPLQLPLVAFTMIIGVANWQLWWPIACFVCLELLMLAIMLTSKTFHKYVRKQLDNVEIQKRQDEWLKTIEGVRACDQTTVNKLKEKIDRFGSTIRSNTLIVNECRRLLNVYVQISRSLVGCVGEPDDLHYKIHELSTRTNRTAVEDERLDRLRKHRDLLRKNKADYELIANQLASIQELIEYTIAKASSFPPNLTKIRVSIESSMETSISEEVLKEMEEFAGIDEHMELS